MGASKALIVLLIVGSTLAGCSAKTARVHSIDYINCQPLGVVSVTDRFTSKEGTVCHTVNQETANNICRSLNYGTAINFGTAANMKVDVSRWTGNNIQAMNLTCNEANSCSYTLPAPACKHTDDLVVQCSRQPDLCSLAAGVIAAIVVCLVFFLLILPLICGCICCCICCHMGVLCFESCTPKYRV